MTSAIDHAVTTTLVHRVQRGRFPWWRRSVVCDFAGVVDDTDLAAIEDLVLDLARVGYDAVVVRPARCDIVLDGAVLEQLITRVHRAGLKVIDRLSGALLPVGGTMGGAFMDLESGVSTLVVRTRAALKSGADGVDLGLIDEAGADPAVPDPRDGRFTRLVQIEEAELADFDPVPILSAEAGASTGPAFRRHLEEEWFHHLRDDTLVAAPWDADGLRGRVSRSLHDRDRLGQVAVWHWSRTCDGAGAPAPGSWHEGGGDLRRAAMALYSLSLPGAVYVPFRDLGGRETDAGGDRLHRTWSADEVARRESHLLARALRARSERSMGSGSLAFVDNLDWSHPGVGIHISAGVMVVLNTSATPVTVPGEHHLVVSSDGMQPGRGVPTVVLPDVCAWFDTARVQPRAVEYHD